MKTIAILHEKDDTYRALAGDKQSTGRTPGKALDALAKKLPAKERGLLVVVAQNFEADEFFSAAQQRRLAKLMRLREAGSLASKEEQELESLVEAELRGAQARAAGLSNTTELLSKATEPKKRAPAATKGALGRRLSRAGRLYKNYRPELFVRGSRQPKKPDSAADSARDAYMSIIEQMRKSEQARTTNALTRLRAKARRVLEEAFKEPLVGKSKAESLDDKALAGARSRAKAYEEPAQAIIERTGKQEILQTYMADATRRERLIFEMLNSGHSHTEIAEHLNIREATVRRNVNRLTAKVRDKLRQQEQNLSTTKGSTSE